MIEFDFDDQEVLNVKLPKEWASLEYHQVRSSYFQVWMQMRLHGRTLFLDRMTPGAKRPLVVNLLDFALGWSWVIDDAIAHGRTNFDPEEYGGFIHLRLLGDDLEIHSNDTNETGVVTVDEARQSARDLNERVRTLLISLDRRILSHPDLGPWFRGEEENIDPID